MKLIIDLPDEVKTLFDNSDISDLRDYYDFNSTIGKAIKNGTPLKKGHWIKDYDNSALDGLYHCSVCGRKLWIPKEESVSDYPYCHCGAEMKGDE